MNGRRQSAVAEAMADSSHLRKGFVGTRKGDGRSFNERRGRLGQPALPGTSSGKLTIPKHVFFPNEPTDFGEEILCIMRVVKYFWVCRATFAGGFVLENEPTGRGFWRYGVGDL